MTRLGSIGVAVALALCLLAPSGASGAQDANCPGPGNTFASSAGGDLRYAQTFTAVNSGQLTTATYFVEKTAGPDFRYDILPAFGGTPAATGALGSATIADAAIPNSVPDTPATGVFSPAVTVTAGQEYALAISRVGGTFKMDFNGGNICPGSFFSSPSQTDPFGPGSGDGIYSTDVEPLPPPAGEAPATPDTTAPDTQIAKGPKSKTKNKTATFEFVSTETGSSFECVLDGKQQFKPCTSPLTVKVKKGKHTFEVRATDAAGNADSAPATASWKVKRKR